MEFYSMQEGCQKVPNSPATYDFTKQMNNLFGCLNSRRPQDMQYNEKQHIMVKELNHTQMFFFYCTKGCTVLYSMGQSCFYP